MHVFRSWIKTSILKRNLRHQKHSQPWVHRVLQPWPMSWLQLALGSSVPDKSLLKTKVEKAKQERVCLRDSGVWRRFFSGEDPVCHWSHLWSPLIFCSSWLRRGTDILGQLCRLAPLPSWSWFFLLSLREKPCKWSNNSKCSKGRDF